MLWLRAALVWALIAALMVAHGFLRERLLTPRLGELRAHQVSCFTGSALVLAVAYATLPWIGAVSAPALQLRVGMLWLGLTIAFEFGFGHWIAGSSWARLLRDYRVDQGRLWSLVLAATAAAPWLAGRPYA